LSDGDLVFVVNPASANGSTGRHWPQIARRAAENGLAGDALVSTRPGEISELTARAVSAGARKVVVVGGDGTVNEAVDGLARSGAGAQVDLAVLPRGTGRDFARSLGIPANLDLAIAVARAGAVRVIDAGLACYTCENGSADESRFALFAGAGISGAIARRANASSKAAGGRVSFIWATLAVFSGWKSTEMKIAVDDDRREGRMFEVLATIGQYAAGGMWVTPGAALDDGLFDVLLIGDVTKADFVRTFPKIYRGRHLAHPKIELLRGKTVRVEAASPLPIALDGEQPGTTPATFEIVPRAVRVLVPPVS
jgi:diacylglycerol kinase (ATP)